MARKTITLEIGSDSEDLLRRSAACLGGSSDLAATAPDGSVLDSCERAILEKGREQQRLALQRSVQARIDASGKKRPR